MRKPEDEPHMPGWVTVSVLSATCIGGDTARVRPSAIIAVAAATAGRDHPVLGEGEYYSRIYLTGGQVLDVWEDQEAIICEIYEGTT